MQSYSPNLEKYDKDSCPIPSYSLYELFSYHILSMSRVREYDELLLVGHQKIWENVKPDKNSIFLKKCKMVISVENRKFSKSRMTKRTASLNSSRKI